MKTPFFNSSISALPSTGLTAKPRCLVPAVLLRCLDVVSFWCWCSSCCRRTALHGFCLLLLLRLARELSVVLCWSLYSCRRTAFHGFYLLPRLAWELYVEFVALWLASRFGGGRRSMYSPSCVMCSMLCPFRSLLSPFLCFLFSLTALRRLTC